MGIYKHSLKSENKNKAYFIQVGIFLLQHCKLGLPRALFSPKPKKPKKIHTKNVSCIFSKIWDR